MLRQHQLILEQGFHQAVAQCHSEPVDIILERPKSPEHGDIACTVALQLARPLKKAPRQIAEMLVEALKTMPDVMALVASFDIAGPGFINMRLLPSVRQAVVNTILTEGPQYGQTHDHDGQSVLLEFVSANPTGPLHLGHARQGALGDVLANIMATQGYKVTREFYYNDAGVQITNLAKSIQIRARQAQGQAVELPEDAYHGEYIQHIAQDYLAKKTIVRPEGEVSSNGDIEDFEAIRRYGVAYLRNEQDDDLARLGVKFDNFYLESSLYTSGRVEAAVNAMIASGRTYEMDGALWLQTSQCQDLGIIDDKDRVMRKADGTFTYFVPDVAYHLAKFERGYTRAINIQGSDHHGTIARVRCGLQCAAMPLNLSIPVTFPEYVLHKMLSVVKDGQPVKMSKRSGNYVTLRDLVDMAGRDAARYFLVARKSDAEFVFDINLAQEKSDENPVYYLQYAHARICSIWNKLAERGFEIPSTEDLAQANLDGVTSQQAQDLLNLVAQYPALLSTAAKENAPHLVCHYLKDVAALSHAFYSSDRVLVDDATLRHARLSILAAARQVLANGLALLGIDAPEVMERKDELGE